MRWHMALAALTLLAGCNTPGAGFMGVPAQRITVDGSTFDVRQDGDVAQALRVNHQWPARRDVVFPRAGAAIRAVTGCKVRRMTGDVAMIRASLSCAGQASPPPHLPRDRAYECEIVSLRDGEGELYCQPPL